MNYLRRRVIVLLLPLTILLPHCSCFAAQRPNVLLILSDDQGSIDLNCYGAHDLATPCLDTLAQHGVRFTQFYAAAPVCSPSRAALLTGRYPQLRSTGNQCWVSAGARRHAGRSNHHR